jgi:hypothetical protein
MLNQVTLPSDENQTTYVEYMVYLSTLETFDK